MSKHKSQKGSMPGDIGYRTRRGRTGLDPIDTSREAASLEGRFIRRLFTGKLQTRKPVYLLIMAVAAIALLALPLIGILSNIGMAGQADSFQILCAALCLWPVGLACLYNTIRSISARYRKQTH